MHPSFPLTAFLLTEHAIIAQLCARIIFNVNHRHDVTSINSILISHSNQVLDAGFIQIVDPDNNDSVSMSELLTAQVAAEKIAEAGLHSL